MKYKIDPIQRSVSVSKKRKGVFMTYENGTLEIFKNDRKVIRLLVKDFGEFLKILRLR